jgi:type IV pilus assembly protein PilP
VKSLKWMISYTLVAAVGLWLAFFASMRFITPAHSQNAPSNGDLPPEFMQEVEKGQVPPPPGPPKAATPAPAPGAPAPAPVNGTPPPANAPAATPPPQAEPVPVGDGATAAPAGTGADILEGDNYVYDPTGKRDPFKPYKSFRPLPVEQQVGKKAVEILEPLQKYELEKLQIVGILWDVKTPRALLRDPDGAVHTVIRNTKLGRNEGVVAAIREGEIVVVETIYIDGNAKKETKIMEFKK